MIFANAPENCQRTAVGNRIPDLFALARGQQQTNPLHMAKMLGGDGLRKVEYRLDTGNRGMFFAFEEFNDFQAARMRKHAQHDRHPLQ